MATTVYCKCGWCTDLELTSDSNPKRCPKCGGFILINGTETPLLHVGDSYYQAQMFRHGRGLDYGCQPRATEDEAAADLRDCLGMMSDREREQAAIESHVRRFRVLSVESDGTIGAAVTY